MNANTALLCSASQLIVIRVWFDNLVHVSQLLKNTGTKLLYPLLTAWDSIKYILSSEISSLKSVFYNEETFFFFTMKKLFGNADIWKQFGVT